MADVTYCMFETIINTRIIILLEDAEINHYVLVLQLYFSQYMRHKER